MEEPPEWQRESARKMIGTIASLTFERKNELDDRATLFRSGVLAFARLGLRQSAEQLDQLSSATAIDLLPLLGQQDSYEAGLWVDILRSRVHAIDQLRNLTEADEKEKVLQQHLFNHLWLLDPSWERATGSESMEQDLRRIDPDLFAVDEDGKEIFGRTDIRYATSSGRHVMVELKRYGRKLDVAELVEQGTKYAQALKSILEQQNRADEAQRIEIIFVLGSRPGSKAKALMNEDDYLKTAFAPFNGRFRLYDELIANARDQYQEYLGASEDARKLDALLENLTPAQLESGEEAADPSSK